jgi:hypothetical protein
VLQASHYGQLTTFSVTTCPWLEAGCAESEAPNCPVKVPVTLVVPLNVPVDVFRLMATQ